MRRLIRWAVYLLILLIVLAVAAILLLDKIAKEVVETRLRARTGMDPRIGQIEIGLLSPTITIENFKLYNTADFGGSLFIDMPELHVEYDRMAALSGKLHFKLVRLNLAEVALVLDKTGRMNVHNVHVAGNKSPAATGGQKSAGNVGNGLKFTGIDTLNLTLGKFRVSNLASGREQEIDCAIKDQITHNIKTEADVPILNMLMSTRAMVDPSSTNSPLDLSAILKSLTTQ